MKQMPLLSLRSSVITVLAIVVGTGAGVVAGWPFGAMAGLGTATSLNRLIGS